MVTTNMAAAAGLISATSLAWVRLGKPDFSMSINGTLAGLVAITAACPFVSVGSALLIGAIGGVLAVQAVLVFDRLRIDDPVGALSVHLVNGIWGTLAVGLFSSRSYPGGIPVDGLFCGGGIGLLMSQLIGIAAVGGLYVCGVCLWLAVDSRDCRAARVRRV